MTNAARLDLLTGLAGIRLNRRKGGSVLDKSRDRSKREKSVDELRKENRSTYGMQPAKTLDQMLAKRASANRGFYNTADGRFGLTELRAQPMIEEVKTSSTA